ncbi:hypothetical protein ABZV61_40335 [Streptomyces sp900116325]|uniref:Uncharacterized protein n=2 Tax=Streptomyces sp. 900116325 TaxID=3154295 RepID=A0ABV2ULV2_9ACTN
MTTHGGDVVVPAMGLLGRILSSQQCRCLMLHVIGRQLNFGDDVTTFAYEMLIDRQVIVFSGGACQSRPFSCRHFPAFGEEGAGSGVRGDR